MEQQQAPMPTGMRRAASGCPFGPGRCEKTGRHNHDYEVDTRYGTRRCSCGSRHYLITTGGPIPRRVICARCRKENYPATCYEAGRDRGPRTIEADSGRAPF